MPKLSGAVTPFGEDDVYSLGDGNYLSRGVHVVKNIAQMLAITPARRKGVYTALGVNANPDPTLCFVKDKGDGKPAMYYLNTEPGTEATSLSNWKLYTPVAVDGVVAIQDYFTPDSTTLVNGVGTVGYVYIAKEAGSFNGETYAVGDWTMYLDGEWKLIPVGLSALPPAAHVHAMSDITGLATALANKIATSEITTVVFPGTKLPTSQAVIDYTYSKAEVDSVVSTSSDALNALIQDHEIRIDAIEQAIIDAGAYTDTQAIAAAKTNIGTGATNFAAGDHVHPNATTSANGFMSADDKKAIISEVVIFRGANALFYDTVAYALAAVTAGDTFSFRKPGSTSTITLKNGVTYQTNGIPVNVGYLQDVFAAVTASFIGKAGVNSASYRYLQLTNAASDVTVEADLYAIANSGTVVELSNGAKASHTGLLAGYGGAVTCVSLTESSKYYHTGIMIAGGSYGLAASGTSYAEFMEDKPVTFNFRPLITLSGSAECVFYGGATAETGAGYYIGKNIGALSGSATLRLKSGVYTDAEVPAFVLTSTAKLYVSSGVTINAPASGHTIDGTAGTVYIHAGATINGTINPALTIVELDSDAGTGGGSTLTLPPYQAVNDDVNKWTDLIITEPLNFQVISLINASGFRAQIIKTSDGTAWEAIRTTEADINADSQLPFATETSAILRMEPILIDSTWNAYLIFRTN